MPFYDTHAHLDYPDFVDELTAVLDRAMEAGIEKVITIGTNRESSLRAIQISERFPAVYAAVGWHPSDALEAPDDFRSVLTNMARHPKVVAIGETGLDFYRLPAATTEADLEERARIKAKQERLFRDHLEVASELGLNCVIHQRECFEECFQAMQEYSGRVRGVFHCFVNDPESARRVFEIGSYVSFTGILTFKNAETVRASLASSPIDRFMLETDSPFLAPVPYRGKRCEPAYVKWTAEAAAKVRNCSLDELGEATCRNAERFFPGLGT